MHSFVVNTALATLTSLLQDASSGEIKKAYRKRTLVLHPDKNEAPDAEEKFRKVEIDLLQQISFLMTFAMLP